MTLKEQLQELQKKYREIEESNRSLNARLSELYILYHLNRILSTTFELEKILNSIFQLFKESLPVDKGSLFLLQSLQQQLQLKPSYGFSKHSQTNSPLLPSQGLIELIIVQRKPIIKKQLSAADLAGTSNQSAPKLTFAGFPLATADKRMIGTLNLFRNVKHAFSKEEIKFFQRIATEVANIIDKALIFLRTQQYTYKDELTDIFNRRYFNQRLKMEVKRAERYKRNLSLLMIDIDDFKQVNDQYGHLKGDEVLSTIAKLLQANIRKADILARFGGEEFVILLPEIDAQNASVVAEKLRHQIEKYFKHPESPIGVSISISLGVANFPADAYSAEKMIEVADHRLYIAKKSGKNQVVAISE